jgi:glucose-6-phosphate 1-dehydrogenase
MNRALRGVTRLVEQFPWAGEEPRLHRAGRCTVVVLGAGGDLTSRKLIPALFHLAQHGLLHPKTRVIGVARNRMDDASFRRDMRRAVSRSEEISGFRERDWRAFAARLQYVTGDLADPATYAALRRRLEAVERGAGDGEGGRLFYFALPPQVFPTAVEQLHTSELAPRMTDPAHRPWARVVIEKPFGRDLESAQLLNRMLERALAEHQIFRIDHYLGKETVQNLLVLRFANSIFEPLWNRGHVAHVQITAAETVGVEHRAGYYEHAGVVRDMFQSHLLQLLTLTAMEPPVAFEANPVRDEKVKVLHAIRPFGAEAARQWAVLGQYGAGRAGKQQVPAYRREDGVRPDSRTPTFAAMRFLVDNWRWQGVPFYLRSGKRLTARATEIALQFWRPPHALFAAAESAAGAPNALVIRIQPGEGISLRFEIKVPGVDVRMTSVRMDFNYAEAFGADEHSAYETLLLDCMQGDATLFARADAVAAAWGIVDPVIAAWEHAPWARLPNYAPGSWGPAAADALLAADGFHWHAPVDEGAVARRSRGPRRGRGRG